MCPFCDGPGERMVIEGAACVVCRKCNYEVLEVDWYNRPRENEMFDIIYALTYADRVFNDALERARAIRRRTLAPKGGEDAQD